MQNLSYKNAVFISDLHLTEDRPDCIRAFLSFLDWLPATVDALLILGDFFEYWVGDDVKTSLSANVAKKLNQTATQKRINIFFVPGNRDFAVGQHFCKQAGMTLIEDNTLFSIADNSVLFCHGDLLCTDDVGYQRFRRFIRHPLVMGSLLKLPVSIRIRIAERLRQNSKANFQKHQMYVDVNTHAVDSLFNQSKADMIVHGHTHMADIHQNPASNIRIVLGDWHHVGWYGVIDTKGPRLRQFDISNPDFQELTD